MELNSTTTRKTPALIVGGGPVGLALAADLGWRGIRCERVEQTDGAISTPKMNEVNTRTMAFCRRWGVADGGAKLSAPSRSPCAGSAWLSGGDHGRERSLNRPLSAATVRHVGNGC